MNEHARLTSISELSRPESTGPEPSLVALGVHAQRHKVAELETIDAAAEWLGRPSHVVRIGLFKPPDALWNGVEEGLCRWLRADSALS